MKLSCIKKPFAFLAVSDNFIKNDTSKIIVCIRELLLQFLCQFYCILCNFFLLWCKGVRLCRFLTVLLWSVRFSTWQTFNSLECVVYLKMLKLIIIIMLSVIIWLLETMKVLHYIYLSSTSINTWHQSLNCAYCTSPIPRTPATE